MNRINDKKEPLIAIVIVMALFVISAGWVNGRMAGTFYVSQLWTDVTLAETITGTFLLIFILSIPRKTRCFSKPISANPL